LALLHETKNFSDEMLELALVQMKYQRLWVKYFSVVPTSMMRDIFYQIAVTWKFRHIDGSIEVFRIICEDISGLSSRLKHFLLFCLFYLFHEQSQRNFSFSFFVN
jgi:hypothetical protein